MAIHTLKVYPESENETKFMKLLNTVNVKPESVICRLGALFGKDYNEYILSDGLYFQIEDKLSLLEAQA